MLRKAIFVGSDGSMGLKRGSLYLLEIRKAPFIGKTHIWIVTTNGTRLICCPYGGIEKLEENWIVKGDLSWLKNIDA